MADDPEFSQASAPDNTKKGTTELPESIPNGTILAYNLDDTKTPGGLKVRFKIRVTSGPEAERWDARQAEAIKELLTWATRHPPRRQA